MLPARSGCVQAPPLKSKVPSAPDAQTSAAMHTVPSQLERASHLPAQHARPRVPHCAPPALPELPSAVPTEPSPGLLRTEPQPATAITNRNDRNPSMSPLYATAAPALPRTWRRDERRAAGGGIPPHLRVAQRATQASIARGLGRAVRRELHRRDIARAGQSKGEAAAAAVWASSSRRSSAAIAACWPITLSCSPGSLRVS